MPEELKPLLDSRPPFVDYEYSESEMAKMIGTPKAGGKVKVHFPDKDDEHDYGDVIDNGYIFLLPDCEEDLDLFDFYIHIPEQENPSGKERGEPVWAHIGAVITNERVSKIVFE